MADLLTHVLAGYVLATGLAWRDERIRPADVTVAMVGAAQPDLNRLGLLLPESAAGATLGVPFSWGAFHTLGGSVVVTLLAALVVPPEHRRRVLALFLLGAASHHALDLLLINPSGYAYPVLWPLAQYHPPSGNLYRSTQWWPTLLALAAAAIVRTLDRRRDHDGIARRAFDE